MQKSANKKEELHMIVIPVYNMILLPEITFYFKKDLFESLHTQKAEPGEDVLFVMQKKRKKSGRSLRQMISIRSVFQV